MAKGVWRWRKRGIIYLSLHCHHQDDSCIKMGSDESHFNVSVGSDGQSHKTSVHKLQPFWRERRAEAVSNRGPSAYQPNALPLGQTGSLSPGHPLAVISAQEGRVQELCESRGGRPGLPVLMSLTVSVDVKQQWTMHTHWSQFVPNNYANPISEDIKLHIIIICSGSACLCCWCCCSL